MFGAKLVAGSEFAAMAQGVLFPSSGPDHRIFETTKMLIFYIHRLFLFINKTYDNINFILDNDETQHGF